MQGNERLEFLGDAVLDLVVARALFERRPEWAEGQLTRVRASLVNGRSLAERARAFLAGHLAAADGGPVEVRLFEVRYGKYARRVVARMETAEAIDLGAALIAAGLAQPYDGGRRPTWCDESMDITP